MNVLTKVSKALHDYANGKYILITLGVFITTIALMEAGPVNSRELKTLSGGTGMLDMHFGYSQQQAYTMLDSIGEHGRFVYIVLLGIDFMFVVAFMLFQSLLLTLLMRWIGLLQRFGILNLLPFLRSGLDILENIMLLAMLFCYPMKLPAIVAFASMFTILKWIVLWVLLVLLLILGAVWTSQGLFSKKKKRKG